MSLKISPLPSGDDLAQLLALHAHRYPQPAHLTVIGDGGEKQRLPLILGNPTGACVMPDGEKVSPAWNTIVRSAIQQRRESGGIGEQLIKDCLLWPDRRTWATWHQRWPGIAANVLESIGKKVGQAPVSATWTEEEEPPATIAAALASRPHAVWRRIAPHGVEIHLAIDPPDGATWRLFESATAKTDADAWERVRELVEARVPAVARTDGKSIALTEMLARWPGAAISITGEILSLVGNNVEVELGEFSPA